MSKRIAVANQKGGVGKSTTVINLAFLLVELGKKVVVVDCDAQGNTSSRLARNLDGSDMPLTGTTTAMLYDPALEGVEVMRCPRGMDLICTPKNDTELSEKEAIDLSLTAVPLQNCSALFEQYDYVLIDCPPSLGRNLVAALRLATHVICPVQVSGFSVDGVEGLLGTIIGVQQEYNPGLEISGVLINKFDRKSVRHTKSMNELRDALGDLVLDTVIHQRPPIDTAVDMGVPIKSLGYGHVAAGEVEAALIEVLRRVDGE